MSECRADTHTQDKHNNEWRLNATNAVSNNNFSHDLRLKTWLTPMRIWPKYLNDIKNTGNALYCAPLCCQNIIFLLCYILNGSGFSTSRWINPKKHFLLSDHCCHADLGEIFIAKLRGSTVVLIIKLSVNSFYTFLYSSFNELLYSQQI